MKNGLVISSRKSGHKRFSVPVLTKAKKSEMEARALLGRDLLAQGKNASDIARGVADKFGLKFESTKTWVYDNYRTWKKQKVVSSEQPGPADAVNDAPPAVRPIKVGGSIVGAVQVPLVTAQRALFILRRELARGETVDETCASLEDAIAKAIGL